MIDRHQLRTLSLAALAVSIVAGGVAFIATRSAAIGLGVPAGALLGLVPLLSWAWLLSRLLEKKSVLLFSLIFFVKVAFYAGACYFLVKTVNPMAVGAGVALTALGLAIAVLLQDHAGTGSRA